MPPLSVLDLSPVTTATPGAQALRNSLDLARHAKSKGVPTLFATGHPNEGAAECAVGCLTKPYSERQLIKAIECVDLHLQNQKYKVPRGLEIFVVSDPAQE